MIIKHLLLTLQANVNWGVKVRERAFDLWKLKLVVREPHMKPHHVIAHQFSNVLIANIVFVFARINH